MTTDEFFMHKAYLQAKRAYLQDEVPVGAVVVLDGKIIASAHNQKEKKHCAIFHAEIIALEKACKKVGDWRLNDASLYVTLEPCAMCAGAIVNHRLKKVFIGVTEPSFGACGSGINILNNKALCTKTDVQTGILEQDCKQLLQSFFKHRRVVDTK